MKYFSWVFGFFILGFIVGIIFFGSATNELKRSQKSKIPIALPLLTGVVFSVAGIFVASNIIAADNKREKLGLNNIATVKFKDGRKWIYESSWLVPLTNETNILKTYYEKSMDSTVTTFNGELIQNHNSNSGADTFVSKKHNEIQLLVIKQILSSNVNN